MSGYTKLFGSILDSTVWELPIPTKITWITMLAMADQYGEVQASIPGLAKRAHVTTEECEAALASFMSPDKYSRSKEAEGRRIEEVDGGWRLINHAKYTQKLSVEDRRERGAERQKRYRWKTFAPLIGAIAVRDGNRCGICGVEFKEEDDIQFDHIIPASKGGDNSLPNIQRAHAFCNQSKHNIRNRKVGRHPSMPPLQPVSQPLQVSPVLDCHGSDDILLRPDSDHMQTKKEPEKEIVTSPPARDGVGVYSSCFLRFWDAYPRKVGKGDAWKAWKRLRPAIGPALKAIATQRSLPDWRKDGGAFIPHPATWLNGRRWEDEPGRIAPPPRLPGPPIAVAELAAQRARELEKRALASNQEAAERFRKQQEADRGQLA